MSKQLFQFEKINRVENFQFHGTLTDFYGRGISATIRENIQNSLDASLYDDKPVLVTITLDTFNQNEIIGLDEVFDHIDSLSGGNEYTDRTIKHLQEQKNKTKIPVMTIEDENTKGLSGANVTLSDKESSTYNAYAYQRGMHPKSSDAAHELKRGGSHGVGKIANNAASDIYLMFFANHDSEGNQHIGGNIQLIEHELDGQVYRNTGYFAEEKGNNLVAYKNDLKHSIYQKNTRGLKNIIPFVREEYMDASKIVKAVCDGFFLAILNDQLRVKVIKDNDEVVINKGNLTDIVQNPEFYETEVSEIKEDFTPLYVKTYLNKEPESLTVKSKTDTYEFDLYFDYDLDIPTGRVGIIRTIGMKIDDFKVKSNVRKPFNAVLIGGLKEDEYLKTLENESHTAISDKDFVNKDERLNATRFINNLTKEMRGIIEEAMEELHPTDGLIDTEDLLYQTEQAFKKNLQEQTQVVEIGNGQTKRKKRKEKRKSPEPKGGSGTVPASKRTRTPRKLQEGGKFGDDSNEDAFVMGTQNVHRLITEDSEYLSFDLTPYNENNHTKCSISIKVVDGNGKELDNAFIMSDNYNAAWDLLGNDFTTITDTSIDNAKIIDNKVQLRINYLRSYNKSLKFIYKVVLSS